jgi:hypothetical protein
VSAPGAPLRDWQPADALLLPGVERWTAAGRWCGECGGRGSAPTHRCGCMWNVAERILALSPGGLFAVLALLAGYDVDRLCAALDYVAEYESRRRLHDLQPGAPRFRAPVIRRARPLW